MVGVVLCVEGNIASKGYSEFCVFVAALGGCSFTLYISVYQKDPIEVA